MKKKLLTTLIIGTIFYFLGRYLWLNWDKLAQYRWDINISGLINSYVILLFYLVITVYIWQRLLREIGAKLKLGQSFRIWFSSQLGKYIPGKVWASLGRIYLCQQVGISKKISLTSIIFEYGLITVSAFIFGIPLLILWTDKEIVSRFLPICYLIPVILSMLHPKIFEKIANFILIKFKKNPIALNFSYIRILGFVVFYVFAWMIMGLAFYYFVNSIYTIDFTYYPILAGIFAISWLVGFLCFFVPAGLGIREGALTGLLSIYLPTEIAIVIAIGSRIWMTLGELTGVGMVGVSNLIKRRI